MWGNQFLDTYSHYNFNFSFPVKSTSNPIKVIMWQYWWWLFFSSIFVIYYFILTKLLLKRSMKFRPKIVTSYRSHGRWGDIIVSLIPIYWCLNILTHSNTLLKLNEMQTETSLVTVRVRGRQWYWIYKIDIYNFFSVSNTKLKLGEKKLLNINFNSLYLNLLYDSFWRNIFISNKNIFKNNTNLFSENFLENFSLKKNNFSINSKTSHFNNSWFNNISNINYFFTNTKKTIINNVEVLSSRLKQNVFIDEKKILFTNKKINKDLYFLFFEKKYINNKCSLKNFFFINKKVNKNVIMKNKYSFDIKNKNGFFFNKITLLKPLKKEFINNNFLNIIDIKLQKTISKKLEINTQKYSIVIDQNRKLLDTLNNEQSILKCENKFDFKTEYPSEEKKKKYFLKKKIWSNVNEYAKRNNTLLNFFKKKFVKTNNNYNSSFKKNKNFLHNQRLLHTNNILVLPVNMNITIITNSYDVIHSWFIPGLGLKMDCVPGRSTHHTLFIDSCGIYYGQCAEICGRFHHHMPIKIAALSWEHFLLWWQHHIKNIGTHQFCKDLNRKNFSQMKNKKLFKINNLKNKRPVI